MLRDVNLALEKGGVKNRIETARIVKQKGGLCSTQLIICLHGIIKLKINVAFL